MWIKVEYSYRDDFKKIVLPDGPPFDGKPVLIKTAAGIVEAWWEHSVREPTFDDPDNMSGFCWICYDSAFELELDDALEWMEIPKDDT